MFKALALAAATVAATAVATPAHAFWNNNQKLCEGNLPFAQQLRTKMITELGMAAPTFTGKVSAGKVNPSIPALGYKQVTGCVTQFSWLGDNYIQSFNVELDASSDQYYINLGDARELR